MSYSMLVHTVCMSNLVRAETSASGDDFFCLKCGRNVSPEEVRQARQEKTSRDAKTREESD